MELPSRQTEPWSNPSAAAVEEEDFRTARRLGVILIVLQAIILHLLSGARLFPAVAVGLACGIGAMQRRWHLDRLTFQLLCVVTAIGFLLHFLISPFPFPEESLFLRTPLAHSIARFLIGLQLLGLAVRQPSGRPPLWLAGLGAMCLPFAANIQLRESRHSALLFWIAAFVAVAALYSSYVRRRIAAASQPAGAARRFVVTAALIGSILLGSGSALALRRYDRHIESFLRDFLGEGLGMARSGFSPSGRLNDVLAWKTNDADHVAMRVFADRAPGYLRGKAFDTYQAPEWESGWRSWSTELRMKPLRSAIAVRGLPPVRNGELVYELISGAGETLTRLDIWPEPQLRGCVFAPLGAAYVASSHHVACDAHGNLTTEDSEQMLPYTVFAAPSRPDEQLSDAMRALLTVLDPDIDPALRRLADNLFADCPTPRAKINRIQSWFRENFSYRLGVRIPRGADPLTYFLMARPPAHCEFFATGTAVLLKLADVPCRYVAGYVATEENAVGGYWIVRNQDAHAWVEAYDEEFRQWLVVDSTPAAGIPTRRDNTIPSQLADTFQQLWTMLIGTLRLMGTSGLLAGAARWIWSVPSLVVLLLAIGGLLLWKSPPLPAIQFRKADRRLRSIHAVLAQLDRKARRQGFARRADETLLQFADRIRCGGADPRWRQEMARCYELYALHRFRGQIETDSVERLRKTALPLLPKLP